MDVNYCKQIDRRQATVCDCVINIHTYLCMDGIGHAAADSFFANIPETRAVRQLRRK